MSYQLLGGFGVCFLAAAIMWLTYAVSAGRGARSRNIHDIGYHKIMVGGFVIFLLIAVGFVEALVRKNGGLWGPPWLYVIHFIFVALNTVLLGLILFKYTGKKYPNVHGTMVYAFLVAFVVLLVTGGALLMMFPHQIFS